MKLAIQKYLREFGLEKTVEDFKLDCKDYGHKVLLKYDQIESDFNLPEVCDARGIILYKDDWSVASLAFRKFFNYGEFQAANIDLKNAKVLKKIDGSLISIYFDRVKEEWCIATSGMAEAEGEINSKPNTTFRQLVLDTFKNVYDIDLDVFSNLFSKECCYIFELTTPYNIVVTPHSYSTITLLAVRDLASLEEISYEDLFEIFKAASIEIPIVECFPLAINSLDDLKVNFENMPFSEEGYVVVDDKFNRVKIKNPSYVAAHFLKSSTAFHHIITLVKKNEVQEFIATFEERKEEILHLEQEYLKLLNVLYEIFHKIKSVIPDEENKQEVKLYAEEVFKVIEEYNLPKFYSGLFFAIKKMIRKIIKDWVNQVDDKQLYTLLTNE